MRPPLPPTLDTRLTTGKIARLLGVSDNIVRAWIDRGELKGHVIGKAARRVLASDLIAFLQGRRIPLPPPLAAICPADPEPAPDRLADLEHRVSVLESIIAGGHGLAEPANPDTERGLHSLG